MKYGVYGMNRIWSMMKRFLLIGLLVTILPFFMMPGFDVSAKGYKVPKPPETINLFGDRLHPVYIGTTSDHMHVYTTQESIDNLLAYKDYDGVEWDLYIILVPGTEELHKDTVSAIREGAEGIVTWLPAKSRTLWGTGSQMFVKIYYPYDSNDTADNSDDTADAWVEYSDMELEYSDMEYYNSYGEIIGFRRKDGYIDEGESTSELIELITDFINKQYDEHKIDPYSSYIQ